MTFAPRGPSARVAPQPNADQHGASDGDAGQDLSSCKHGYEKAGAEQYDDQVKGRKHAPQMPHC